MRSNTPDEESEMQLRLMLEQIDRENAERRCFTSQTIALLVGTGITLGIVVLVLIVAVSELLR